MLYLAALVIDALALLGIEWLFRLGNRGRRVLIIICLVWAAVDAVLSARDNPGHMFIPFVLSFCDSMAGLVLWEWVSSWIRGNREHLRKGRPSVNVAERRSQGEQSPHEPQSAADARGRPWPSLPEHYTRLTQEQQEASLGGFEKDRARIGRAIEERTARGQEANETLVKALPEDLIMRRLKIDRDLTAAAQRIAESAIATALSVPPEQDKEFVLICVGSPGSGKTSTISARSDSAVGLKIEQTMDEYESSQTLVQQVFDSGRQPVILWLYVDDFGKTVDRMLRRAMKIGRADRLEEMVVSYKRVPEVLSALRKEFPTLAIYIADNSGTRGEQRFVGSETPGDDGQTALRVAREQVDATNLMFRENPEFEVSF